MSKFNVKLNKKQLKLMFNLRVLGYKCYSAKCGHFDKFNSMVIGSSSFLSFMLIVLSPCGGLT